MVGYPGGGTTATSGQSPNVGAVTNPVAPVSLAFDNSGNLLIAEALPIATATETGIQFVAKAACASSCSATSTRPALGGRGLYTVAGTGSWTGVQQPRPSPSHSRCTASGWPSTPRATSSTAATASSCSSTSRPRRSHATERRLPPTRQPSSPAQQSAPPRAATVRSTSRRPAPRARTCSGPTPSSTPVGNVYVNDNQVVADTGLHLGAAGRNREPRRHDSHRRDACTR